MKICPSLGLGLFTRHPKEEATSFGGDFLKELSIVHERDRKAMRSMIKELWPNESPPQGMVELAERFKGAKSHFDLWKTSTRREGAREAWAMVKTHFIQMNQEHMARVGPAGPDGKEIPLHLVYDQVMPATYLVRILPSRHHN